MLKQPFVPAQQIADLPVPYFTLLAKEIQRAKDTPHATELINLAQGSPDLPTPKHIVKSLQAAAENPLYHKYPLPFSGYRFLKEAIAKRYAEDYGVKLDPEREVALLSGSRVGLVEICQCILDPDDLCLVPDPGYPDYLSGISLTKARMDRMPIVEVNQYFPDFRSLGEKTLDEAKLMFLNYPNNPTGAAATSAFFREAVRMAHQHDIWIAHDFAYGAFGFDNKTPVSFLSVPGAKEIGVEFYTLSKTYNMTGWRVAFALGNAEIIQAIELLQDHYFAGMFGAMQEAAATALLSSQEHVRELCMLYEERRDLLFNGLQQMGWKARPPQGSYFCWLPVPEGFDSRSFSQYLMDKARVVVAPGYGFGEHGDGYVRLGLNHAKQDIEEALKRFASLPEFR